MAKGTGIIATKAAPRQPIPTGNHVARCYLMILIGTITEEFKKGSGDFSTAQKVRIGWEFPDLMHRFKEGEEEKPYTISTEYTLSTGPKANLRKVIDSWRGKPLTNKEAEAFDLTKLLGKACMIQIVHKPGKGDNADKIYEQIAAVASIPKGLAVPEPFNEQRYFNYDENFDPKWVQTLPDFIKNRIMESAEWKANVADGTVAKMLGTQEAVDTPHPVQPSMENEVEQEEPPF